MQLVAVYVFIFIIWLLIGRMLFNKYDLIPEPDEETFKFFKATIVVAFIAGPFGLLIFFLAMLCYVIETGEVFNKFFKRISEWSRK